MWWCGLRCVGSILVVSPLLVWSGQQVYRLLRLLFCNTLLVVLLIEHWSMRLLPSRLNGLAKCSGVELRSELWWMWFLFSWVVEFLSPWMVEYGWVLAVSSSG